jgi:hypothetical protein
VFTRTCVAPNSCHRAADVVPADAIPTPIAAVGVGVTLYLNGVIGSSVSGQPNLDDAISAAATAAARDSLFVARRPVHFDDVGVSVSLLYDREHLGHTTASSRRARSVSGSIVSA